MILSAEEFLKLRTSENPDEYRRSAQEAAPIEVWNEIIDKHPEMKTWVIHNKTVPLEILWALSDDPDHLVRSEIASKRKLDKNLFEKLANDHHETVRQRLSYNKKTPREILRHLANDPEVLVSEPAKQRLARE